MKFLKDHWFETVLVIATAIILVAMSIAMSGCAHASPAVPPNPIAHPGATVTETVVATRHWLTAVNAISFVLFLGSVGLSFVSALSWISRIASPVLGTVAAGSFVGLIVVPYLPWIIGGATVLGLIYEAFNLGLVDKIAAYFKPAAPAPKA